MRNDFIDIVFDGPPGPESGRFIEVEDPKGNSVKVGDWIQRDDRYWVLRIVPDVNLLRQIQEVVHELEIIEAMYRPKQGALMEYEGDNHGDTKEAAYNRAGESFADKLANLRKQIEGSE